MNYSAPRRRNKPDSGVQIGPSYSLTEEKGVIVLDEILHKCRIDRRKIYQKMFVR